MQRYDHDQELTCVMFMIDERPLCVWEWGLRERQVESLERIDPAYFTFQSDLYRQALDTDQKKYAACAIRMLYWHALETFFSLLFAAIQAPHASYAWLVEYKTSELCSLVDKAQCGTGILSPFRMNSRAWEDIARLVLPAKVDDPEFSTELHRAFGSVWKLLGEEFVDPKSRAEYNTIKHGMRLSPGGFRLSIGPSGSRDNLQSLGGSEYGATFFMKERIGDHKHHFRCRRQMENWYIETTIERIQLVALSIDYVKAFLLKMSDALPDDHRFQIPTDVNSLMGPWRRGLGVQRMDMDLIIRPEMIKPFTVEEIRSRFSEKADDLPTT